MDNEKSESAKVQQVYAAIIASFILNFVPNPLVQIIASLFFLAVFIALYIVRKFSEPESLTDNHMTYLIRSMWIGGGIVIIGSLAGIFYFIHNVGFDEYAHLGQLALESPEYRSNPLAIYFERYPDEMIAGVLLTVIPGTAYLAYRIAKGLARAIKGYRVANPKAWF